MLMPNYIPKYILKRLFPAGSVKKVEGGMELTMHNVLSPIAAKDLPADATKFISAKVDGKPIPDKIISGLVVTANGKKYTSKTFKELNGQILPVGSVITFFVPYTDVKVGEEHEIDLDVKETKFQFVFKTTVV
jgi:hypothetical protein